MNKERNLRLIAVFIVAALLFNFPILQIFGKEKLVAGLPLLYLYFFLAWAMLIAAIWYIVEIKK